jgi:hypothetical protein
VSNGSGFLATRRGLLEHLRDGRLTLQAKGAFQTICEMADWKTGVWWGSARALAAICGAGDVSERQARHLLESLEAAGYIKRFAVPGKRGNYGIVVHKFEIRVGELVYRVNAALTQDCKRPVLELCQLDGEVQGEVDGEVSAPLKEVRSKQEKKPKGKSNPVAPAAPSQAAQTPATPPVEETAKAESKPPANLALLEAREFAHKDFERRNGQKPTWNASDFSALADLFHGNPALTSLEFQRRWLNFADCTDAFELKQGMRLRYFCNFFDKFLAGPILERKGGTNGKRTVDFSGTDATLEKLRGGSSGMAASVLTPVSARTS